MNFKLNQESPGDDKKNDVDKAFEEKMADALTPGVQVECSPDEAVRAGAFIEDALNEDDAIQSCIDLLEVLLKDSKS